MRWLLDQIVPLGPWYRASGYPFLLDTVRWLRLRPIWVWVNKQECVDGVVVNSFDAIPIPRDDPQLYEIDSMAYIFDSLDAMP